MDPFFVTPPLIGSLSFIILLTSVAAYLLTLKGKTAATWWLASVCMTFALIYAGWAIQEAIPATRMSDLASSIMFVVGAGFMPVLFVCFAQFAYTFRGNPYPKESRWLLAASGLAAVALLSYLIDMAPAFNSRSTVLFFLIDMMECLSLAVWCIVVLLRKAVRFSRDAVALGAEAQVATGGAWRHLWRPQGRSARASLVFAGLALVLGIVVVTSMLVWGVRVNQALFYTLFTVAIVSFTYGLIAAYVTYAPEPTTVQVKLVGAVLATVLLLVALISRFVFSEADLVYDGAPHLPSQQTLRFEPNTRGGYDVSVLPLQWVDASGERVAADTVGQAVALGYAFPFYGVRWDSVSVLAAGRIDLGTRPSFVWYATNANTLQRGRPKITICLCDLDPASGGGIFIRREPRRTVVTWRDVALQGADGRVTVQVVLHQTGVVDLSYGDNDNVVPFRMGSVAGWGLSPGGPETTVQPLPSRIGARASAGGGTALVVDAMLANFRYAHTKGIKLLYVVIACTVFVLAVMPFVFWTGLLRPLARLLGGVKQVEAGDLDVVVPVQTQDEIGTLTQHFNRMTYAVRHAEAQLNEYATTLEEKVAARTAELAQSLKELKAAQARLVQSEKMASLGALTAGIAHEIKNPLNFVSNFAVLSGEMADDLQAEIDALEAGGDPERLAEISALLADLKVSTAKIAEHGRRADGIVQSMLLHSRGAEGERRAVDVNALVEEYAALAYHGMRAQVSDFNTTIDRDLGEDVGRVDVAPQEIGRVLLNLLNNAFQALHDHPGEHPTVRIVTRRVDGHVEIRVEDNGPGIPGDIRERIFEPFFSTKPTGEGTGLGLSISYDIVTQGHGGTLTVESEPGEGTSFVVTLPA